MRWSQKLVMLSLSVLLLSCSAIPPRLRTVNILVDEDISLAAGDRVNVFMIDEAQTNVAVLDNVAVMAADQKVGIVTLLVSPEDAQRITDAGEQPKFSLRLWKSE